MIHSSSRSSLRAFIFLSFFNCSRRNRTKARRRAKKKKVSRFAFLFTLIHPLSLRQQRSSFLLHRRRFECFFNIAYEPLGTVMKCVWSSCESNPDLRWKLANFRVKRSWLELSWVRKIGRRLNIVIGSSAKAYARPKPKLYWPSYISLW